MAIYSGRKNISGHSISHTLKVGKKIVNWPKAGPMGSSIAFEGPGIIDEYSEYLVVLDMGRVPVHGKIRHLCTDPFQLKVAEFGDRLIQLSGENEHASLSTRLDLHEMEEEFGTDVGFKFAFGAKGRLGKAADPFIFPVLKMVAPSFVNDFHTNVVRELGPPQPQIMVPGIILPEVA